jgi:hypothetical protein
MPKRPQSFPLDAPPCDPRLLDAALDLRLHHPPPLTTDRFLNGFNVTAWLYQERTGTPAVKAFLNTTIEELVRKFGPAETPDAEVGFHSEMHAAQWFRTKSGIQILQIFSERIPCPKMCGPMLKSYYPGVPWYYYYNAGTWRRPNGRLEKYPAEVLKFVYGLQ